MEFYELMAARRSVRRFLPRLVPQDVIERMLNVSLSAPSSRNSRSSRLLVVDDPVLVARMASMRDYGSAFMDGAPLAVVVLGEPAESDMWQTNAAITATVLHQAAVAEGLGSCWVQIAGRPRRKDEPQGEQAEDYLRTFLPIPPSARALCAVVMGYSDHTPRPLPAADDEKRIIRLK